MKNIFIIAMLLITNFTNAQIFTKYVDKTQSNGQGFCYNVTLKLTLLKMATKPTPNSTGNGTEYSVELVSVDVDKNKGWYQRGKIYNCSQLEGICNLKNFSNMQIQLAYRCGNREIGSNTTDFYDVGEKKTMILSSRSGCSDPIASGIGNITINNNDNSSKINLIVQKLK